MKCGFCPFVINDNKELLINHEIMCTKLRSTKFEKYSLDEVLRTFEEPRKKDPIEEF